MIAPLPRVLYLINSLEAGGAEVGLANLMRRGVFEGFDLAIITIWPPSPEFLTSYPEITQKLRGTLLPYGNRTATELGAALASFRRVAMELSPDVVVASLPQAVIIARLGRMLGGCYSVLTFEHNERLRSSMATTLIRLTARWNDGVLADSVVTLEKVLKAHGYRGGTPTCLLSLQSLESCFKAPAPNFEREQLRLIFVGRLLAEKNMENCLRALALARDCGVPINLAIYGDGEELSKLRALAVELSLHDELTFHGVRFDWPNRAAGIGAFGLLASEREGLSITALQFLALGFPLLTTAAGQIACYLKDGHNGVVTRDMSAEAIAEGMIRVWDLRDRWADMASAARSSAKEFETHRETTERDSAFRTLIQQLAFRVRNKAAIL